MREHLLSLGSAHPPEVDRIERNAELVRIATARLNDIDPYLYLRHVLERIAEHPINRIDELLPWNIAAKLDDARCQAA